MRMCATAIWLTGQATGLVIIHTACYKGRTAYMQRHMHNTIGNWLCVLGINFCADLLRCNGDKFHGLMSLLLAMQSQMHYSDIKLPHIRLHRNPNDSVITKGTTAAGVAITSQLYEMNASAFHFQLSDVQNIVICWRVARSFCSSD